MINILLRKTPKVSLSLQAFRNYLKTIPGAKKHGDHAVGERECRVKDIVARASPGIGSAGKISYSILVEGPTETLESDIILYMKPAQKSAISHVVQNAELEKYFLHDGQRTVLCSYAMQAATPKWLGYTSMRGVPYLVDEATAHSEDLEWDGISDLRDIFEIVTFLGQATG